MDSLLAIGVGLALRLVLSVVSQNDFRVGGSLVGLWEGVVLYHFLAKMPNSNDPFIGYGVRLFVDLLFTESLFRMALVVLWTGLGMVLSDIAPVLWYDLGLRHIIRRFRRDMARLGIPALSFFSKSPIPSRVRFHSPSPSRQSSPTAHSVSPSTATPSLPGSSSTSTVTPRRSSRRVPGAFPDDRSETTDSSSVQNFSRQPSEPDTDANDPPSDGEGPADDMEDGFVHVSQPDPGSLTETNGSDASSECDPSAANPLEIPEEEFMEEDDLEDGERTPTAHSVGLSPTPADLAAELREVDEVQPPHHQVPVIPDEIKEPEEPALSPEPQLQMEDPPDGSSVGAAPTVDPPIVNAPAHENTENTPLPVPPMNKNPFLNLYADPIAPQATNEAAQNSRPSTPPVTSQEPPEPVSDEAQPGAASQAADTTHQISSVTPDATADVTPAAASDGTTLAAPAVPPKDPPSPRVRTLRRLRRTSSPPRTNREKGEDATTQPTALSSDPTPTTQETAAAIPTSDGAPPDDNHTSQAEPEPELPTSDRPKTRTEQLRDEAASGLNRDSQLTINSDASLPESDLPEDDKDRLKQAATLRKEAKDVDSQIGQVERERKDALEENNAALVLIKRREKEKLEDKHQKLHKKAERRTYNARNKPANTGQFDTQGLQPQEAIQRILDTLTDLIEQQSQGEAPAKLQVKLGQGKKKMVDTTVMKHAVGSALREYGIRFSELPNDSSCVNIAVPKLLPSHEVHDD